MISHRICVITLLIFGISFQTAHCDIEPLESWNCFFGKQQVVLRYRVPLKSGVTDRFDYLVAIDDQVIAQRVAQAEEKRSGGAEIEIPIELPVVSPGKTLQISVALRRNGESVHRRELWIFADNSFAGQKTSLEAMNIRLFDPVKKTASIFEKSKLSFELVHNVDRLSKIDQGTLVIGEGVSFRSHRSLAHEIVQCATRGVNVVCFAPADGDIAVSDLIEGRTPQISSISFRRNEVIKALDKKLDDAAWPADGRVIARSLKFGGERSGIVGAVEADDSGWPWVHVKFANEGGQVVFCGFAIIEKWEKTPVPRYLIKRVFEDIREANLNFKQKNSITSSKGPNR